MALRNALLRHIRVQVGSLIPRVAAPLGHAFRRWISEEVRGTFVDKSEVAERVIKVVKMFEKVDPAKVTDKATFNTLGLDSLDSVEIVMALEEEFGFEIPDNEADKIDSISTAIDYIAAHPQAK